MALLREIAQVRQALPPAEGLPAPPGNGGRIPRSAPGRARTTRAARRDGATSFSHSSSAALAFVSPRGQIRSTSTRVPSAGSGSS